MAVIINCNLPLKEIVEGGVDTSKDTVTPDAMREGFTAHDASGEPIEGTIPNYDGSITEGATEGAQIKYDEGFADGKQAEQDAFWDEIQDYGRRTSYEQYFSPAFTEKNFFPKYSIRLVGINRYVFRGFAFSGDLARRLEDCGVSIDTSECNEFSGGFINAYFITCLPHLMLEGARLVQSFYSMQELQTFSLTVDEGTQFDASFDRCINLENLTIEGTIGKNGFDVKWSPLSKASLTSIVNALSATTTGLTVTLRLDAVKRAFETSEGANDGNTSDEWTALAATKPNWTINLINS